MSGSIARASAIAGAVLALGGVGEAAAVECHGSAIGSRFVEASRLCGRPGQPVRADAATGTPAYVPVEVAPREAVSVSMPGYRRRLAGAVREVGTHGGAGATSALVTAIAHRYRINPRLLASIMRAESAGRPGAVSSKGALGLMQVMPGTARGMGVRDPQAMLTNPVLAMSTGAAYLKRLQAQFGNDVPVVVAAYNAGPGAVMKARRRIPRYRETQGYVRNVMGGFSATHPAGGRLR